MPTLMVIQGPDKGRRFRTVEGKTIVLGRASDDVPLSDYTVSRRHAELRPTRRGWAIADLKSSNGTYLNGSRLERPMRLKHGDMIRMGATMMIWDGSANRVPEASAAAATVTTGLVDLDAQERHSEASIIGSVTANDDSMILATPAAAEAVRSWRVVSSLLQAASAAGSPRALIGRVLDILFDEVPVDRGFVLMRDEKTRRYEVEATRRLQNGEDKIFASRTIVDHVITHREGVLCSNAMSDARFTGGDRGDSVRALGLQSVICVPMSAREDLLGVIYIDCAMARHVYTEEQLRLVASIAQMAALAIEDARLVKERVRNARLAATGETVAALSHSIKNILQGMKGGSDIVTLGLRGKDMAAVEQGWQIVDRNLDKIYSLTMNMLAFSKRREPKLAPVQLASLIADVLKLVRGRADDKGVLLRAEPSDVMPAVHIDENGIHQAVMNIVVNAIDAVPKTTGVVTVKAEYDPVGQTAALTVGDNGPGIPDEAKDRLFDPFYSTKGHGGTGLGLAVAKKIVDEHFGRIEVSSEVGQGTLIRIILPANPKRPIDTEGTHGPALPAEHDDTPPQPPA